MAKSPCAFSLITVLVCGIHLVLHWMYFGENLKCGSSHETDDEGSL